MTVRFELIETHDTLILQCDANHGDRFSLPQRPVGQEVLIGWGACGVIERRQAPWEVAAPAMILFPAGEVELEARSANLLVYILYDKGAGPLQDVRQFARRPQG